MGVCLSRVECAREHVCNTIWYTDPLADSRSKDRCIRRHDTLATTPAARAREKTVGACTYDNYDLFE